MSVEVDGTKELMRRLNAIKDTRDLLAEIQLDAVAEAKRKVPRKTGNLGRSIGPGGLTKRVAIVHARANYAAHVEFGTRPHVIKPRRARVLAWPQAGSARLSGRVRVGGSLNFARLVNHPGTRAQPYLIPGAIEALKRVGITSIIRRWNKAA